jgi:hypothetical protein
MGRARGCFLEVGGSITVSVALRVETGRTIDEFPDISHSAGIKVYRGGVDGITQHEGHSAEQHWTQSAKKARARIRHKGKTRRSRSYDDKGSFGPQGCRDGF